MQIHELTSRRRVDENFMTNLAKAAGGAVKGAVGGAVQGIKDKAGQIGAQLKDPKAWVSTRAATAAAGGAQLKQQTARYAQQLAGEWAQQSKSLVDAEAKAKMAGAKQTPATTPTLKQAPQKAPAKTTKPTTAKSATTKPATTKPGAGASAFGQMANQLGGTSGKTSTGGTATPTATGVKHTAGATNPNQPVQSMADFAKQYPTAKYHEVTGEITPYGQQQADIKAQADKEQQAATAAKYKQQAADKAAAEAPPAPAPTPTTTTPVATAPATDTTFDPTDKASVDAFRQQMQQTATDVRKSAQSDPNAIRGKGTRSKKVPSTPGEEPVSIGGQKLNPKDPKQAELIAKARAADKPVTEAFADLPGAKPQAGGAVNPKVTAPVGKQGNPLTSAYITAFKKWSDAKLATKESSTGETITMQSVAKENPQIDKGLRSALANIYNTRQDPKANGQAVTAYMTQAIQAIQQIAAKKRKEALEKDPSAGAAATSGRPGFADPRAGQELASKLNLDLAAFKQALGKEVVKPTGNSQLDGLLKAAGAI